MMKKAATPLQRLERSLTADQIQVNPLFRQVFLAMRTLASGIDLKTADELAKQLNVMINAVDFLDPIGSPLRELKFSPKRRKWWLIGPLAWRCLETLVECANRGELGKFRECPMCKRWFFARTLDHKCCTARCRQRLYASTPEGRKKRAEDMRKFRAREKKNERRQAEYLEKLEGGLRHGNQAKRLHRTN
jgi:hypothetical protein